MIPFLALLLGSVFALGGMDDVRKQVRWMKKMSGRGPIFWALAFFERVTVRFARKTYGEKLDVVPNAPVAIGTEIRGALKAKIKWIPGPASSAFSKEAYEVQIRPEQSRPRVEEVNEKTGDASNNVSGGPADDVDDAVASGWVQLLDGDLQATDLMLKPLVAATTYDVRVRATNSKGASAWKMCTFSTKHAPVLSEEGERAGGYGPCVLAPTGGDTSGCAMQYRWAQHLKDETVVLTVGPLPPSTRAKMLEVKVTPTQLTIKLNGSVLLTGEFFAPVVSDDLEWELRDAPPAALPPGGSGQASTGGGGRELCVHLIKGGKSGGPFWPVLLKAHAATHEIDVSGLKRKEKDLDELMAELSEADAMKGMHRVEELKRSEAMKKAL